MSDDQPPRDGEPDFMREAEKFARAHAAPFGIERYLRMFGTTMYRLGLSHRDPQPKVEDAEVAEAIRYLTQAGSVIEEREIADLLERLARELAVAESKLEACAAARMRRVHASRQQPRVKL